MHPNSLQAHKENIDLGKYRPQIQDIIKALRVLKKATMHEIADHLGKRLNCISGRFGEMSEKGIIVSNSKINNRTVWVLSEDHAI